MNKSDMKTVYTCMEQFGDGFWNETPAEGAISNKHLLDEIVILVNKAGYDLQLIKLEDKQ